MLDPAIKKIFIEHDSQLIIIIPVLIILAFATKGASLYLARIVMIGVAEDIKKDVLEKNLYEDIWENDKYVSGGIVAGKSKMHDFMYSDNSAVRIICYELNDEAEKAAGWKVKMEVIINSKEFNEYLMK